MLRYIVILLIGTSFLTGCIMHDCEHYPASWPVLRTDSLIKSSTGTYPGSLLYYLSDGNLIRENMDQYSIAIKVDSIGKISMTLYCKDQSLIPILVNSNHFLFPDSLRGHLKKIKAKQKDDYLLLVLKEDIQGGNPVAGFSRNYIKIYRLPNNEIILCKGEYGAGLIFMLVPCYYKGYKWYKLEKNNLP